MMYQLINGFSSQIRKAVDIGQNQRLTAPTHEIRNIVVAGLGGSGIGGNLLALLTHQARKLPLIVIKNYEVPAFVNEHTLFIASSFSGNTEETLTALEKVKAAKIACITSGGKLLQLAIQRGYDFVQIPNEAPCPRAFLGYSLVNQLFLLKNYGLISMDLETELLQGVSILEDKHHSIQEKAKDIARHFYGKLPVIYADDQFEGAIIRLQQQINENAKQLCHTHVFPEMNHNELVGWQLGAEHYQNVAVAMVRTSNDQPRVSIRMDICAPIFKEKTGSEVWNIEPLGKTLIEQHLYLIHLFDWVSFYLAELNEVDPFPVEVISHLKTELSRHPS